MSPSLPFERHGPICGTICSHRPGLPLPRSLSGSESSSLACLNPDNYLEKLKAGDELTIEN
jgi:hypothetical protein